MGVWIFGEIFEIAKILQIYKENVGRGNFKMAAILRWVLRFCSTFFQKLRNNKVGKVKKFEYMVAIENKCGSGHRKLRVCGIKNPVWSSPFHLPPSRPHPLPRLIFVMYFIWQPRPLLYHYQPWFWDFSHRQRDRHRHLDSRTDRPTKVDLEVPPPGALNCGRGRVQKLFWVVLM